MIEQALPHLNRLLAQGGETRRYTERDALCTSVSSVVSPVSNQEAVE
jgi:hypothetical protein